MSCGSGNDLAGAGMNPGFAHGFHVLTLYSNDMFNGLLMPQFLHIAGAIPPKQSQERWRWPSRSRPMTIRIAALFK